MSTPEQPTRGFNRRAVMPVAVFRLGRITQWLPVFKGLSLLLSLYRRFLPHGQLYRITNFDGDLKLNVDVRETIGINLWHSPRLYEKRERELFCSAIKPGCTVLDVGANIGIYTLLAAKRGAQVFAIEADPLNAKLLRQNVEMNGLTRQVTIWEIAAVTEKKIVTLHRNTANSGGSSLYGDGNSISIEGCPIDFLKLPRIDICKMDIEGAELDALGGMLETLERSPGMKLLVECTNDFKRQSELFEFVRKKFKCVSVVGTKNTETDKLPPYCNLWAFN